MAAKEEPSITRAGQRGRGRGFPGRLRISPAGRTGPPRQHPAADLNGGGRAATEEPSITRAGQRGRSRGFPGCARISPAGRTGPPRQQPAADLIGGGGGPAASTSTDGSDDSLSDGPAHQQERGSAGRQRGRGPGGRGDRGLKPAQQKGERRKKGLRADDSADGSRAPQPGAGSSPGGEENARGPGRRPDGGLRGRLEQAQPQGAEAGGLQAGTAGPTAGSSKFTKR